MGLEYLQRRRCHNIPGQPVPGLRHPQREEVLPRVQLELPLLQFVPVAPCPVTGHHWKELGPILLTPTLQIFVNLYYILINKWKFDLAGLAPHPSLSVLPSTRLGTAFFLLDVKTRRYTMLPWREAGTSVAWARGAECDERRRGASPRVLALVAADWAVPTPTLSLRGGFLLAWVFGVCCFLFVECLGTARNLCRCAGVSSSWKR